MSERVEITDAEAIHLAYVQKKGIPTVERVEQLKKMTGTVVLNAAAIGGEATDSLDLMSILNEWLIIHTDRRLMEAFTRIASMDVMNARQGNKKGMN